MYWNQYCFSSNYVQCSVRNTIISKSSKSMNHSAPFIDKKITQTKHRPQIWWEIKIILAANRSANSYSHWTTEPATKAHFQVFGWMIYIRGVSHLHNTSVLVTKWNCCQILCHRANIVTGIKFQKEEIKLATSHLHVICSPKMWQAV